MTVGGCNKCGEQRELVFTGRVCERCNDLLDFQLGQPADTNWVLIPGFECQSENEVLRRYVCLQTPYASLKELWAAGNPPEVEHGEPRLATPADVAEMLMKWGNQSSLIRPATSEEVEIEMIYGRQWRILIGPVEESRGGMSKEAWLSDANKTKRDQAWEEGERRLAADWNTYSQEVRFQLKEEEQRETVHLLARIALLGVELDRLKSLDPDCWDHAEHTKADRAFERLKKSLKDGPFIVRTLGGLPPAWDPHKDGLDPWEIAWTVVPDKKAMFPIPALRAMRKAIKARQAQAARLAPTGVLREAKATKERAASPASSLGHGLSKVVGMAGLKEQLVHDVIGPLQNPGLYSRYRVALPNGILFYGPPGCGKTYIARSLAEELGWSFQYCRPSDIASPYIHDTVSKIRAIFSSAFASTPSIVFIDEFEAFVPPRSELGGHQQFKAEEVNEFLANLEGCAEHKVLVIAATNEPGRIDPAVRRSGRFDKMIFIPPPDGEARRVMLDFHLRGRPVEASLDTAGVSALLDGYSASDIKLLVDEAARSALRQAEPIGTSTLLATLARVPASISAEDVERCSSFSSRGS